MKNENIKIKNNIDIVSNGYLSFVLMYNRKRIVLLNFDAEDCILYDKKEDAFLNLYLRGFKDKNLHLKIVKDAGNWQIVSNREVFVNGVAWRKRVLRDGDKIFLGEYRLIFEGYFPEQESPDPISVKAPKWSKRLRFIEAAAVILRVSLFWFCTTINHNGEIPLSAKDQFPAVHESEFSYKYSEELDDIEDAPYINKQDISDLPLFVYTPGDTLVPEKLDILFIHAHPDDESLDYGLYMAEAAAEGESMGVILFTDGDSGFDRYPDRPVDGIYPDAELGYPDLAKVRVLEAEKALTVLGAKVYVRLGLWNRPYTAKEANKSINTLVSEWGGQDFLVDKLVHLIEIFKPDIIVSPDGPSKANEHFEHETVGYISEIAVNIYRQRNPGKLKAYLKLVDVQQTEKYAGTLLLDIDARGEPKYTEIKRKALMMHQTQADASYYGIKRLEDFPVEYYKIQYCSEPPEDSTLALLDHKMADISSITTY